MVATEQVSEDSVVLSVIDGNQPVKRRFAISVDTRCPDDELTKRIRERGVNIIKPGCHVDVKGVLRPGGAIDDDDSIRPLYLSGLSFRT